jgi:hypothetical protein
VSVHDDLRALRTLLEKPEHWRQGYGMRALGPHCVISGLVAMGISGATCYERTVAVQDALADAIGCKRSPVAIGCFNDEHTHAEVLAAIDRAIEATAPSSNRARSYALEPSRVTPAGARRQSFTTEGAGQGALGTMPTADGARDHAA